MAHEPVSRPAVKAVLQAYVDKDRNAIEAVLADDYRFTSPIDNALDRDLFCALLA